jgi:hypothetical protein
MVARSEAFASKQVHALMHGYLSRRQAANLIGCSPQFLQRIAEDPSSGIVAVKVPGLFWPVYSEAAVIRLILELEKKADPGKNGVA